MELAAKVFTYATFVCWGAQIAFRYPAIQPFMDLTYIATALAAVVFILLWKRQVRRSGKQWGEA